MNIVKLTKAKIIIGYRWVINMAHRCQYRYRTFGLIPIEIAAIAAYCKTYKSHAGQHAQAFGKDWNGIIRWYKGMMLDQIPIYGKPFPWGGCMKLSPKDVSAKGPFQCWLSRSGNEIYDRNRSVVKPNGGYSELMVSRLGLRRFIKWANKM